jgi:hypothetical protein
VAQGLHGELSSMVQGGELTLQSVKRGDTRIIICGFSVQE